jgi:hypothetical protein
MTRCLEAQADKKFLCFVDLYHMEFPRRLARNAGRKKAARGRLCKWLETALT